MKTILAAMLAAAAAFSALAAPNVVVRMGAFPEGETPAFTQGAVVEVVVSNASGRAISGDVALRVTRWDGKAAILAAAAPNAAEDGGSPTFSPGEIRRLSLPTADLAPDGYVLTVVSVAGNGGSPGTALSAPLSFGVFAPYDPRELFGIGNGMVCEYWPGHVLCGPTNAFEGRDLHPVALGKADAFEAAIVGAPCEKSCGIDWPEKTGEPDINTPDGRHLHMFSPAGRAELMRRARKVGEQAARNPQWAAAKLMNEQIYLNRRDFCPDHWADGDFRRFLQERYGGDLARLNVAWGTDLADWDEAVQPISAAGGTGQGDRTGGDNIDWLAAMGNFTAESKAAIRRNPAQSMDWFRWRAAAVNQVYAEYIAEAKKAGPGSKILFGNNYPWPNFYPHVIWPQWRSHDVISLDLQYVCGFEKTLGTNEEMIDILEAAESIGKRFGKPVWGREVYVQPRYPGEVAALQNWAMVAHGVDVTLVFAWKPFSDWGRDIFKKGPRSWEKSESPPMWFLIDTDGTRLPAYEAVKRSAAEIAGFHANVDARQLRRIPGETALFWTEDTSVKIVYDTFDRPWETRLATDRTAITAGLRYRGARIEFLDDAMLGELTPERHPVCVVPPAPVVSDTALAALRAYVAAGGRLVLFAPFNTLDVNLRPKVEGNTGTHGWTGDILVIDDFPGRYNSEPHEPEAYARWFDEFVEKAGIPRSAWWECRCAGEPPACGDEQCKMQNGKSADLGISNTPPASTHSSSCIVHSPLGSPPGPGKGLPVVEVVVRRHERTGERFAFVLNKGGAGFGHLCGPDFEGATLRDALTGETVPPNFSLSAFGYRFFEIL